MARPKSLVPPLSAAERKRRQRQRQLELRVTAAPSDVTETFPGVTKTLPDVTQIYDVQVENHFRCVRLLPCPFCGGVPRLCRFTNTVYCFGCDFCGFYSLSFDVPSSVPVLQSLAYVVERWNARGVFASR